MKVLIIRHPHKQTIGVYDADGVHLMYLPWNHLVNVKLGGDMRGMFDAEWNEKTLCLEIGDRKR